MLGVVFLTALGVAALACGAVAVLTARHRSMPGATPLFAVSMAELWWILTYAGEMLAPTPSTTFLLARVEWVGVVVLPVAWTAFVLEYTGRGAYLTRRTVAALSVIPAVTLASALSAYDGLIRQSVRTTAHADLTVLTGEFGPVLWLFALYTWLLVAGSAILLLEFVVDRRSLYQARALSLMGAAVAPLVASYAFATDILAATVVDPTPIAFALSSSLALVAILEYDMLDRAPVASHLASETAVEAIDDPVFVVDASGVVVDCNPAALSVTEMGREELLGRTRGEVELIRAVEDTDGETTLTRETDAETTHYDVRTAAIDGTAEHEFGEVITLRDVTERRERKERLDALTEVLRATIQEEMTTVQRVADDGEDAVSDVETLKERASVALDVSDRAAELATMVSPEEEPPADIVPIIHEEIAAAREWKPDVTFVLEASLGEWAHCSGLFEPVFRVSLRHAAARSVGSSSHSSTQGETSSLRVGDPGSVAD
ncbi:histidine kinase N-terminal 7TM domain-containing protein [Haloarcula marina]|uniref:histidine kinase N-terminal 7TM domain-containing protein n=1 Tax=Haloarcula marina TaxID=2961574 RepID=UPI0020B68E8A|nr:histidine kinase N-terminal 7TM domain-containing protein [Halomicroarcula marina]